MEHIYTKFKRTCDPREISELNTNENSRKTDCSFWHRKRLQTRWCTVYTTVWYCPGEGDKEYRDQSNGTIFNRTREYIAYADDVLILGWSVSEIKEVVTQSKEAAVTTSLVINKSKTKHMKKITEI